MSTVASNAFEIERRGILWTPLITLNDGVTSLGYDNDPNNVIDGNTPGESWLYSLPIGQFYKQNDATLWWKSDSPNTWINLSNGNGGSSSGTPQKDSFIVDSDIITNNYIDLSHQPVNLVLLYNNGLALPETTDWSISNKRITFIIHSQNILTVGDVIEVDYNY